MENYYKYWGKAQKDEDGNYSSHLLVYHSLDTAAAASVLLKKEHTVVKKITEITDLGKDIVLKFLLFIVSIHDIGKFSITFQNIIPELLQLMQGRTSNKQYQYDKARHDQLGMYLFETLISDRFGEFLNKTDIVSPQKALQILWTLMNTSFGHHGIPPRNGGKYLPDFYDRQDQDAAAAFFTDMSNFFLSDKSLQKVISAIGHDREKSKQILNELKPVTWSLAGIITLSDWIASGSDFKFQNTPEPYGEYWGRVKAIAEQAVHRTGILPSKPNSKAGFSFIFPELSKSARHMQKVVDEIDLSHGPQLFILEDLTGSGKTEAAMTLVSKMMASGIASGFYIGLPTMATANAMYERMGTYYRKFFSEAEKPSIVLSHGSRHLSEVFRSSFLMNSASDTLAGYDETSAEANAGKFYCTNWLADSTKKSLLADIGVGTIDQLLLSILPVRYQDLRLYGMKNKVLVVDEVHAYDPYMNKLLCAVLKAHIAAGGSAVLLSATIPQVLKRKLVDSYYEGLGEDYWYDQKVDNFPLLTKADKDNGLQEIPVKSFQKKRHVTIDFLYEEERIYKKITNSIKENICISWIRNTVYDVLEAYEKLTREYGVSEENIIVFHSRFAYADRSRIEGKVIRLFGKNSKQNERAGKVVIATQVIEQSLDLDFDVMVSDLAPVELIIQRAGRLQRHDHGDRCKPVMYIYSPPETDNPEAEWYQNVFPKASGVYRNTAILWRTKEILKKEEAIVLPQKARLLIESVYGDDPIQSPECFSENEIDALGETMAKEDTADFSKLSLENGYCRESAINEWDEEEKITTRLSDEQCTVYICFFDAERIKPLYGGEFPWEMSSLKIRKGKIKKMNYQGEINKAIEQKKAERNFRQDDIFLIADRNSNSNEIIKMELENLNISYSSFTGLQVEEK